MLTLSGSLVVTYRSSALGSGFQSEPSLALPLTWAPKAQGKPSFRHCMLATLLLLLPSPWVRTTGL